MSYDEGNFRAYWAYDSDTDSLTFKLVVKATGWVAFGFATTAPADMENYDVAVGGVRNGVGYIKARCYSCLVFHLVAPKWSKTKSRELQLFLPFVLRHLTPGLRDKLQSPCHALQLVSQRCEK